MPRHFEDFEEGFQSVRNEWHCRSSGGADIQRKPGDGMWESGPVVGIDLVGIEFIRLFGGGNKYPLPSSAYYRLYCRTMWVLSGNC